MKPVSHPTALRTAGLLEAAGIVAEIVEFEQATRTSADAAAAIGCSVAEIAKSVVFRGLQTGRAVVVVASGANRVGESRVSEAIGEPLGRADPDFVRAHTGYVIGGVAPIGHPGPTTVVLDEDLKRFECVWAAAGTPFSVFPLSPAALHRLTGAPWIRIRA